MDLLPQRLALEHLLQNQSLQDGGCQLNDETMSRPIQHGMGSCWNNLSSKEHMTSVISIPWGQTEFEFISLSLGPRLVIGSWTK
ncbi:unnamed protein product [Boreogadus saida]